MTDDFLAPTFEGIRDSLLEVQRQALMERRRRKIPIVGPWLYRRWSVKRLRRFHEKRLKRMQEKNIIESYKLKVKWDRKARKPKVDVDFRLPPRIHEIQVDWGLEI